MTVKLLARLVEKNLRWDHMNAELPAGLMVLTHIDKDDLKLPLVCVAQISFSFICSHRDQTHRAKFEHNDLAFLFGLT